MTKDKPIIDMSLALILIATGLLTMLTKRPPSLPGRASPAVKDAIRAFEGLKLTASPDPTGTVDIGYGHVLGPGEIDQYRTITIDVAERFLDQDIKIAENCVRKNVRVDLTQNEYDALISFVFNVGCGNFSRSTMLQLINSGRKKEAAEEFDKWVFSKGIKLAGLVTRRAGEKERFLA